MSFRVEKHTSNSTKVSQTSTRTRRAWRCERSWPHSPTGSWLANGTSLPSTSPPTCGLCSPQRGGPGARPRLAGCTSSSSGSRRRPVSCLAVRPNRSPPPHSRPSLAGSARGGRRKRSPATGAARPLGGPGHGVVGVSLRWSDRTMQSLRCSRSSPTCSVFRAASCSRSGV